MYKITANIILLGMFGVWAYLCVIHNTIQPVSGEFMSVCAILVGGGVGEILAGKWQPKVSDGLEGVNAIRNSKTN